MAKLWIPIAVASGGTNAQNKRHHMTEIATAGKYLLTESATHSAQAHCRRGPEVCPATLAAGLLKVSYGVADLKIAQGIRGVLTLAS